MGFINKLQKLFRAEELPPVDCFAELARTQDEILAGIQKNSSNLSLQIEEIYDIIKEFDEQTKEIKAAAKRENLLLDGLAAMSDLLDGLIGHMQGHSRSITTKKEDIINACGMERLGFPGERFDPRLHTVASAEPSTAPLESVIRILESGYEYRGKVIRKATVILSKGVENDA